MIESFSDAFSDALRDFNRALELSRDSQARSRILTNRALVKHKLGDKAGAMVDIDNSITMCPGAQNYFARAVWKTVDGKQMAVEGDFKQALKRDYEWAKAATIAWKKGQPPDPPITQSFHY